MQLKSLWHHYKYTKISKLKILDRKYFCVYMQNNNKNGDIKTIFRNKKLTDQTIH